MRWYRIRLRTLAADRVWAPTATSRLLPPGCGGRVGTSRVVAAVNRVTAAGIPAVAGEPVLEQDVPAGQNETRPPMYEMGGLARRRRARSGQLPGLAGAARRPPVPGIRAMERFPGSSHVPGVTPRWCPFPTVRAFLLPPRTPRKSLKPIISDFLTVHTVSTERMPLSAPDGGYPPANSQAIHKSPWVIPGTPIPARRRM
jgi:hypothetical protein